MEGLYVKTGNPVISQKARFHISTQLRTYITLFIRSSQQVSTRAYEGK